MFRTSLQTRFMSQRRTGSQHVSLTILNEMKDKVISIPSMQKAAEIFGQYWKTKLKHCLQVLVSKFSEEQDLEKEETRNLLVPVLKRLYFA